MPARHWTFRLEDILEAINRIQRYTASLDFANFQKDEKTIDAVVRNLEIIGEAAKHIPPKIEKKYPDIPWSEMKGMRNVLSHEYFGVNVSILWQTVQHDLPPLVRLLRELLDKEK